MSTRRQTLGPLNSRRSSMTARGTPSIQEKSRTRKTRASMLPRDPGGRQSLVPNTPVTRGRRQSVGGDYARRGDRRQSFAVKQDPRPITDRAFQNTCIQRLLEYLKSSGYDKEVSTRTLARPSAKDFKDIVTFMLKQADPTFANNGLKLADEVAIQFKALGYPFTISKTSVVSAGAPHTWASLLAALTWLMTFLMSKDTDEYRVQQQQKFDDPNATFENFEDLERKSFEDFRRFINGSYRAFIYDNEKEDEQLQLQLHQDHQTRIAEALRMIEEFTDFNGTIVQRIKELEGKSEEIKFLEKRREEIREELEDLVRLVRQMDEHKESNQKKLDECTMKLQEATKAAQNVKGRMNELQKKIDGQELSVHDVRKMKTEEKRLGETLERLSSSKEQHTKTISQIYFEYSDAIEQLENEIAGFNIVITATSGFSDPKYRMNLNTEKAQQGDQTMLLGADLKSFLLPQLTNRILEIAEGSAESRKQVQTLLDDAVVSEERSTEVEDELKIMKRKQQATEELLSREKQEHEGAHQVRQRATREVEEKIFALHDPVALEEAIARLERRFMELESLLLKRQEANEVRKKTFQHEIEAAVHAVLEHKQYVASKLEDLKHFMHQKRSSTTFVKGPNVIK